MADEEDKVPELIWENITIPIPKEVKIASYTLVKSEMEDAVRAWTRLHFGLDWKRDKIEVMFGPVDVSIKVTRDA